MELPPRARRILNGVPHYAWRGGTTSACAENTGILVDLALDIRNYLRVRGEYGISMRVEGATRELPPRARRIRDHCFNGHAENRTTSACAENTTRLQAQVVKMRNYLRVRGEYSMN